MSSRQEIFYVFYFAPVPERRPPGELRWDCAQHPQQREGNTPRAYHSGGVGVAPVGDGGGRPGASQVRYSGNPVIPPGGGEAGCEDGQGCGCPEAADGVLVGAEES